MRKKWLTAVLAFVLIFSFGTTAALAEGPVQSEAKVLLDGQELVFQQPVYLIGNELNVPYRELTERAGGKISWNGEQREVTVEKDGNTVVFAIDSAVVTVNGVETTLDLPISLIDNSTYGPVKFLAQALGLSVADDVANAVSLKTSDQPGFKVFGVNEGDVVHSNQVKVAVAVFNLELTDFRTHMEPASGQGHVHLWLDTNVSDPLAAVKQTTEDPVEFSNVPAGDHTLTVQLVGNDHQPIQPEVKQVIHFKTESETAMKPSLTILSPTEGSSVSGTTVTAKVDVQNFDLVDFRTHTMPMAGQGHLHFWLDTDVSDPLAAVKQITEDPVEFSNVPAGDHTLTVQLVGNDHQPIQPEVKQVIHFKTESETAMKPSLTVLSPTEGSNVSGTTVTAKVDVQNFDLVDFRTHTMPMTGQGHLHFWLDTDVSDPLAAVKQITEDPVVFNNVPAGDHTLTVQLVGNDHQPIQPEVKQVIHFKTTSESQSGGSGGGGSYYYPY